MPLLRIPHCALIFVFVLLNSAYLLSQNQSDPQAVALAQQSVAALTNRVVLNDVTLTGNATWIAGSDNETVSATLQAKGTGESRTDLNLSGGIRTEIRNDLSGSPQGETIVTGGTPQSWAQYNCWINAGWFFPALSTLAETADPSVIFSYIGLESRGAASVQHIRVYRYLPYKKPFVVTVTESVSTEDIYLDSSSLLPVAFNFNTHPDDDALTNIAIEIDFSNYQPANGIQIPMRVQKLISGGLALDVVLTGATLNSGLSDALFAIQ